MSSNQAMNDVSVIFAGKEQIVMTHHSQRWPLHNHTKSHHPKAGLKGS